MSESFIKALKWGVLVSLVICGIYGLSASGAKEDFRYIMVTVLSFGAVSLMFRNWSELPGKIMAFSAVIAAVLAFLAQDAYVPFYYYTITEKIWIFSFFQSWALLVMTLGVVIMTYIFWKFDD